MAPVRPPSPPSWASVYLMEMDSVSTSVPPAAMPTAWYDDGYAFVSFHSCTVPPSASQAMSVTSLTVSGVQPFWAILEIHFQSAPCVSTPRASVTSPNDAWTPVGSGLGLPCSSQTLNSLACRLIDGSPHWWNIPMSATPSAVIFQYLIASVFCSGIAWGSPDSVYLVRAT